MTTNSTQIYVDNEKSDNFISGILSIEKLNTPSIQENVGVDIEDIGIDIDLDIERQIAQLQEAKMQTGIKKVVPVDFDTELGTFFSSIAEEKKDLEEKVKQDEVKINEFEKLFSKLTVEKKKLKSKTKKKTLLVEPEIQPEKLKEVVNEVAEAEQKSAASIMEYLLPKEVEEYNEDIIGQVSKKLSEMQVATELDKDKIKSLKSIDSLEKLKAEFLGFKDIVARQMSTIGGGGLNPDKVDSDLIPVKTATFSLGSPTKTFKDLYLSGSSLVIGGTTMDSGELTVLDNVTTGTISASKAVIVDSSKDITGFRNVTATGTSTFGSLSDGSITITAFVDEDNMASNSATLVPTQQSVKAYVDSEISGVSTPPLLLTADDEGSLSINLTAEERLTVAGGTGVATTSVGNTLTISVDSTILNTTTGSTKAFAIAQAVALG